MMREYYGTKKIQAEHKVNGEGQAGYIVVYPPDGYRSWSPKDVFEAAYRESGQMDFGHAIMALKEGKKVARAGWNGKGMWLILVEGSTFAKDFKFRPNTAYEEHVTLPATIDPHIDMFTANGHMQPGWLASQADMLATDWSIVD